MNLDVRIPRAASATFVDGRWQGRADFLLRLDRASDLGPWSYEPIARQRPLRSWERPWEIQP